MNTDIVFSKELTVRITALWAFSEAFLGGILHGFKVPFTGLILSAMASLCMALIALYSNKKWSVINATFIVMAIKFILSPHTPPMAYVAVLIEGAIAQLIFFNKRNFSTKIFCLTVFCLVYSAFQHLLILTVVLGKAFWDAIDIFCNAITKTFFQKAVHYSLLLVIFYLSVHIISGFVAGFYLLKLIRKLQTGQKPSIVLAFTNTKDVQLIEQATTSNKNYKKQLFFGATLIAFLIVSYIPTFSSTMLKNKIVEVLVRGTLILIAWNFFVLPLVHSLLQRWVQNMKTQKQTKINEILLLMPTIKKIIHFSWQNAKTRKTFVRIPYFISNAVMIMVYG